MSPDPTIQRAALAAVSLAYAGLFGWLLVDTARAETAIDPRTIQTVLIPILSGSLGLVLALALGVPVQANVTGLSFAQKLRRLWETKGLLRLGAITYGLSAIAGGIVWGVKGDVTPELVTAVVLTVSGYAAAAMTAIARS